MIVEYDKLQTNALGECDVAHLTLHSLLSKEAVVEEIVQGHGELYQEFRLAVLVCA